MNIFSSNIQRYGRSLTSSADRLSHTRHLSLMLFSQNEIATENNDDYFCTAHEACKYIAEIRTSGVPSSIDNLYNIQTLYHCLLLYCFTNCHRVEMFENAVGFNVSHVSHQTLGIESRDDQKTMKEKIVCERAQCFTDSYSQ